MYNAYVSERIKTENDYCFDKEVEFSATMQNAPVAERFTAIMKVGWEIYKADRSAFFESGSYNFVDRHFAGLIDGPSIDPQTADPQGNWERLARPLPPFDAKGVPI